MFGKKEPPPEDRHPSQDRSNRFAMDALLRKHGFQIVSRPKQGPVIWKRNGREYTQRHAESLLDAHDVDDAAYLDSLYRDGWTK